MRLIAYTFLLPLLILFAIAGCSKKADPTPNPAPTPTPGGGGTTTPTTPASTFNVDGKWECLVDGVPYAGTVDTSYVVVGPFSSGGDTTLWCTGTSDNKRANIHFRFTVHRSAYSPPTINTFSSGHFTFDTSGSSFLQASYNATVNIAYTVDTLKEGKLKARFSGTANEVSLAGGSVHTITAGKFSCEIGKGSGEPKFFSFTSTNNPIATGNMTGFFRRARLLTNEIMLEGIAFAYEPTSKFRLVVRTGGTVKPGVYKSSQGEVGLQYYVPSLTTHYVNDSLGDLTVTITSVADNVVKGTFSGSNFNGTPITGGAFSCRLKDYRPQAELPTRWQFSFDEQALGYNCYAGNVTGAVKTQVGGRYLLTVNGESDHNSSVYKLVLSSTAPLTTGLYRSNQFGGANRIDSVYFRSNEPLWNGNTTYLFSAFNVDTWCRVDSLDANKVVGTLFGRLAVFYSAGGTSATDVKLGTFRGAF